MIFAIKMLGAISVAAAVFIIISIKIREKRKGLLFVTDFISALKHIEDLISFSAASFADILEKTAETAGESREFFEGVAVRLKNSDNPTLADVWSDTAELLKEGGISEGTINIIKKLGSRLGAMSVEIETENLSLARNELYALKDRLAKDYIKESKLIKSLGMALCGFIILIFI